MLLVYILTNRAMPDIVKVGSADHDRLRKYISLLDDEAVPWPFECFYAVKLPNAQRSEIKDTLHQIFADGFVNAERGFVKETPEKARKFLKILEGAGGTDVTKAYQDVPFAPKSKPPASAKKRRAPFHFELTDLKPGTRLQFVKDNSIECEIYDKRKVIFRGGLWYPSSAAAILMKEMGKEYRAKGPCLWCYQGKTLTELRKD